MKKKQSYVAICIKCGTERKTVFNIPTKTTILRCAICCELTIHVLKTETEDWE